MGFACSTLIIAAGVPAVEAFAAGGMAGRGIGHLPLRAANQATSAMRPRPLGLLSMQEKDGQKSNQRPPIMWPDQAAETGKDGQGKERLRESGASLVRPMKAVIGTDTVSRMNSEVEAWKTESGASAAVQLEDEKDAWVTVGIARVMILTAACLCGTNFAGVKLLQKTLDPSTFMSARFLLAGVMLLPAVAQIRNFEGDTAGLVKDSLGTGALLGFGYVAQSLALKETGAGTTAFLCSLTTVVCPVIEQVVGMKVTAQQWTAAAIAVLGAAVLELTGDATPGIGDLYALLQPIFFGLFFYLTERTANKFPGAGFPITSLQVWACVAVAFGWALVDHSGLPDLAKLGTELTTNFQFDLALMWCGGVATALILVLETIALSKLSSSETAVVFSSEPIWGVLFASILLGETVGSNDIVGGALIISACLLRVTDLNKVKASVQEKLGLGGE